MKFLFVSLLQIFSISAYAIGNEQYCSTQVEMKQFEPKLILLNLNGFMQVNQSETDDINSYDKVEVCFDIVLKRSVYFEFDEFELSNLAKNELIDFYNLSFDKDHVIVEGHTDPIGDEMYNISLGLSRAESVKDYLRGIGMNNNRIETFSAGENVQNSNIKDINSLKTHRRVDIYIVNGINE